MPAILMVLVLFVSGRASALVERNVSLGFSVGAPQLAALEGTVLVSPHVQAGFSFGVMGLGLAVAPKFTAPTQDIKLIDGNTYQLTPETTLGFNTLCPFIRIFPGERNFYFQLTLALYRVTADVTASISGGNLGTISASAISGDVTFLQMLPTISIGHLFMSKIFFANLSLGASFVSATFVSTGLSTSLPDIIGGAALNQGPLNEAKLKLENELLSAADEYKRQFVILPSIMFSVGFMP